MIPLFRPPNRALACDLETERFALHAMGRIEMLRVTNSWRSDTELLAGLMSSSRPKSLRQWVGTELRPNNVTRFAFAIVPKGGTAPIGVHFVRFQHYRAARNSVALHDRAWWGKGVVVEVRARLMNHFFANAPNVDRFIGEVNSRNVASLFTYRRLGYDHVGTWHRHKHDPATREVGDLLMFEMFRAKWQQGPFAETTDAH